MLLLGLSLVVGAGSASMWCLLLKGFFQRSLTCGRDSKGCVQFLVHKLVTEYYRRTSSQVSTLQIVIRDEPSCVINPSPLLSLNVCFILIFSLIKTWPHLLIHFFPFFLKQFLVDERGETSAHHSAGRTAPGTTRPAKSAVVRPPGSGHIPSVAQGEGILRTGLRRWDVIHTPHSLLSLSFSLSLSLKRLRYVFTVFRHSRSRRRGRGGGGYFPECSMSIEKVCAIVSKPTTLSRWEGGRRL